MNMMTYVIKYWVDSVNDNNNSYFFPEIIHGLDASEIVPNIERLFSEGVENITIYEEDKYFNDIPF